MPSKYPLRWVSHPMREYPITTGILLLFLGLIAAFLWDVTSTPVDQSITVFTWVGMNVAGWDMPFFYYLGIIFLFFSLITYFIPTYYQCDEDLITIRYWFFKVTHRYDEYGCFYLDAKGVMLSTFKRPRRLDPFRGLSLRFSRSRKEKQPLLDILQERIGNRV